MVAASVKCLVVSLRTTAVRSDAVQHGTVTDLMSSHELPSQAVLQLEAHEDLLVIVSLQHVLGLVGVNQPEGHENAHSISA